MSVYAKDNPSFLKQAIDSMLNQTIKPSQFVIVEDGILPKKLQDIINNYAKNNRNLFTVVNIKKNVGLGKALDKGLEHCKYNLIARMDADDISKPERCEKLLKQFINTPELSIVGTNVDEFIDEPNIISSSRIVPSKYEEIKKFSKRRNPFNHPSVMFKKSEVIRCGGYGELRRRQDYDLWSRMLNMNCYAKNLNESLLLFRIDENYQKRRKSWENCKSSIIVAKKNYERGYCSKSDLIYVICGQMFLHCTPLFVSKAISNRMLRGEKDEH